MSETRMTAGQLSLKAAADNTKYDPYDIGYELSEKEVLKNVLICAENHVDTFDEDEYCIVMLVASDCMLKNLVRMKYYAWPYLPSPRPNQSVFLFNKKTQKMKFLWSLPNPEIMARLSESIVVKKELKRMKGWCDSFYDFSFWHHIRDQHKINMPSESEYLILNREKLIQAGCKIPDSTYSETFNCANILSK